MNKIIPITGTKKFELVPHHRDDTELKLRVALGWDNDSETIGDYIQLSIEKWEALVIAIEQYKQHIDNGDSETCALCMLFRNCLDCPVGIYTGRGGCQATSYYDYTNAWRDWKASNHYAKQMVNELKEVLEKWRADNEPTE